MLHDFVVTEDEFLVVTVDHVEFFEFVNYDSFQSEYQVELMSFFVFAVDIPNRPSFLYESVIYHHDQPRLDLVRQVEYFLLSYDIQQVYALFPVEGALGYLVTQV